MITEEESRVVEEICEEALRVEKDLGGRYLALPHPDSREAYTDLEEFIATLKDGRLANHLSAAIRGRGAFRRFKDVLLDYPEEEKRWFEFKSARLQNRVKEWLESEDIIAIPT